MFSSSGDSYNPQYEELLRDGITAAKNGSRKLAQSLLNQATMVLSHDSRPWIWLSATTDDPQEQRQYLERAVAANPSDAAARRGLMMLSEKLDKTRLVEIGAEVAPRRPTEPEDAQTVDFLCPKCGGHLQFEVNQVELTCQYCGYTQAAVHQLAADSAEQGIDYVLPTTRAHRWAEAQQRVSCQRCGSITLLPAGQTTNRCAYCGSNRLVQSAEAGELVDPQVIGLMKVDEQQARKQVQSWFGKGLFAPDDLSKHAAIKQFRPAYYPFWTFDGTLEIPWHCEVNEGSSRNPHWVGRNGAEIKFFDDVLIPGLKSFPLKDLKDIEPFPLKELVEFSPEYVVGWLALTYDYPLSDAMLRAREKVIKEVTRNLYANVLPGEAKRNLSPGAGMWSGITFKHVLLPIWVGTYIYKKQAYRLLVNGQTGKVGGTRPRDRGKITLILLAAFMTLLVLAAIIFAILNLLAGV